jgi:transposase-like protein
VVTTDSSGTVASAAGSASDTQAPSGAGQRRRRARRTNLSEDQKREITRLYSETSTPLPEIRQRFGIGDSSLYRLIQQYGGKLRGRAPRATQASATTSSSRRAPRAARATTTPAASRSSASRTPRAARASRSTAAPASRSTAAPARATRRPRASQAAPPSSGRSQFRVSFVGVRTVTASNIADAVRQASAFGATEITGVVRQE